MTLGAVLVVIFLTLGAVLVVIFYGHWERLSLSCFADIGPAKYKAASMSFFCAEVKSRGEEDHREDQDVS